MLHLNDLQVFVPLLTLCSSPLWSCALCECRRPASSKCSRMISSLKPSELLEALVPRNEPSQRVNNYSLTKLYSRIPLILIRLPHLNPLPSTYLIHVLVWNLQ
ncbi:hypothetical protein KC19_VG096400 [Ceratodon purpureus]|uniref:Secreted protein n=1 Tax=Ceratodon purpureus TaxID=3225 RepID=A0A8T0HNL7_CERPU|nr:hypothetical protein KC19_VG096400 [Ceratodon purpureus]